MRHGIGNQKYIHRNNQNILNELKRFAKLKGVHDEDSMMTKLLQGTKNDEEFDEMMKHLYVFLGGGYESSSISLT